MSWYVRKLLFSRDAIKAEIVSEHYNGNSMGLEEPVFQIYNFDLDIYEDLLSIEYTIKYLVENNLLSKSEIKILNHLLNDKSISDIEIIEDLSRHTVVKRIVEICNRIAYHLGYYFTDHGFIEYLRDKYGLDESKIKLIEKIIKEET